MRNVCWESWLFFFEESRDFIEPNGIYDRSKKKIAGAFERGIKWQSSVQWVCKLELIVFYRKTEQLLIQSQVKHGEICF